MDGRFFASFANHGILQPSGMVVSWMSGRHASCLAQGRERQRHQSQKCGTMRMMQQGA